MSERSVVREMDGFDERDRREDRDSIVEFSMALDNGGSNIFSLSCLEEGRFAGSYCNIEEHISTSSFENPFGIGCNYNWM